MTEVILFHADWCGHCQAFKPQWEALKPILDQAGIKHSEYEDKKNKDKIKEAKIEGYPTIRIKKDNEEYEYMGPRSAIDILASLGVEPKVGQVPQTGGAILDGGKSSAYTRKYQKYKSKYLSLKKWMKKMGYLD